MLCKDNMINLDFKSKKNNAKHKKKKKKIWFKKFNDKKQKTHIILNEQCKCKCNA